MRIRPSAEHLHIAFAVARTAPGALAIEQLSSIACWRAAAGRIGHSAVVRLSLVRTTTTTMLIILTVVHRDSDGYETRHTHLHVSSVRHRCSSRRNRCIALPTAYDRSSRPVPVLYLPPSLHDPFGRWGKCDGGAEGKA